MNAKTFDNKTFDKPKLPRRNATVAPARAPRRLSLVDSKFNTYHRVVYPASNPISGTGGVAGQKTRWRPRGPSARWPA